MWVMCVCGWLQTTKLAITSLYTSTAWAVWWHQRLLLSHAGVLQALQQCSTVHSTAQYTSVLDSVSEDRCAAQDRCAQQPCCAQYEYN
jgi:hypothetical protein